MHPGGSMYEETTFTCDCEVVVIPDGYETTIPEGAIGFITQVLGGNFTVQMTNGYLVRVAGKDAEAIGREIEAPPEAIVDDDGNLVVDSDTIWTRLRTCYDPEIPVNIVDLGLVYECEVDVLDGGIYNVKVRMTLTAPGCGMGQVLVDDVEYAVKNIPGVEDTDVELVFDPAWNPDMMTEAARLELGLM
jgi:probable FeS assembly SUF system protein SufT